MNTIYRLGRTGRDVWNNRVAETPDRPFLNFQERRWTYREADAEIRSIKSALYAAGLRQGDSIVVGMANSAATLFTQFAVRQLGAVLIPMVPDLGLSEMVYQVGHSEARFMMADDPLASLVLENRDQFPGLQTIVTVGPVRAPATHGTVQLSALPTDGPGRDFEPLGVTGDTLSEIVYTSGSTARPKGVMLPAGAFVNGAFGYAERFGIGADDSYLLPFTFGHATASIIGAGIPLLAGGQLTIVDRFSPSLFWSQVERYRITKILLFPAQINLLLDASQTPPKGTSTLDLVITHEWIADFWEKSGIPMATTWGQTETGASGAGSPLGFRGDKGQGYIGRAYPDAELAAFDEALVDKPRWLLLNKLDMLAEDVARERVAAVTAALDWKAPWFALSALAGEGTDAVCQQVMQALDAMRAAEREAQENG
ncbi:MAG: AMP-binding protein [Lysobacteraceae bacterium]